MKASPQPWSVYSTAPLPSRINPAFCFPYSRDLPFCSSSTRKFPRVSLRCNCSGDSGEDQSRAILDAFFLGKAVAEAVNERIESAVGEFLSTIGRLQAEQQKQVQEFQEDVLERAKRAKEQAAREAMEARGLIPNSTTDEKTSRVNGVASDAVPSATSSAPRSQSKPNEDSSNID